MNLLNQIAEELRNKEEYEDIEFFRAIQKINANYIILSPTKKSVEFTKKLNEAFGYEFDYKNSKLPIGMTFEELLLKALAFYYKDPFDYINKNCIIIEKTENILNYLDSIQVMSKLTNEENPDFTSAKMKLLTDKFQERIQKQFEKKLKQLLPSEASYRQYGDYVSFNDGYGLVQIKVEVRGSEEEHKKRYMMEDSPSYNKLDPIVNHISSKIYGREYEINQINNINLSKSLIKQFDGETIFLNEKFLYQSARWTKRQKYEGDYFYCYLGLFLTYNQYCDIAK